MSKKLLFIISFEDFQDQEFADPKTVLEQNGYIIEVASLQKGKAIGKFGLEVTVDFLVKEININDYQGVVFIGGSGMAKLTSNQDLIKISQDFRNSKKLVAAICVAPEILANAGLLKGIKATSWSGVSENLRSKGAIITDKSVEVDDLIITADGPVSAISFGQAILQFLKNNS